MTHASSTPARALWILLVPSVLGLAACTSSAVTSSPSPAALVEPTVAVPPPAAASDAPPATPVESAAAASLPSSEDFTPVPTSIDPCQLVTQEEAGRLVGATLGPGQVSTLANNDRMCEYSQEGLVFEVLVAVAPDAATAKADEPAFKAQLEQGAAEAGIANAKLTEMPDFEPGVDAALISGHATVGSQKISAIALYALKGAVAISISDIGIGGGVASSDDMQAQARVTLGRLP